MTRREHDKLAFVTVSGSVAAAVAFYVDGLDWDALVHVPGEVLMLQVAPGVVLSVHETAAFAADTGSSAAPAGFALARNVPSDAAVDDVVREMADAGAVVVAAPRRASWGGWYAHVRDPLGVLWEVTHNPGWSVDPDGTVRLSAPG